MLPLHLDESRPARILCLGAHCDDIEIGCGGTLLTLLGRLPGAAVRWVVFSGNERRHAEARASAAEFAAAAGSAESSFLPFRESFFPSHWAAIKEEMEKLKAFEPTLVLTHWTGDAHQDHRLLGELTWNTFRDHLVLQYEIPKYDGEAGAPNLFVPVARAVAQAKADALIRHFASQRDKPWFTGDALLAAMRMRGVAARSPTGLAEAFYAAKLVLQPRD